VLNVCIHHQQLCFHLSGYTDPEWFRKSGTLRIVPVDRCVISIDLLRLDLASFSIFIGSLLNTRKSSSALASSVVSALSVDFVVDDGRQLPPVWVVLTNLITLDGGICDRRGLLVGTF
jgi:hypothetical protein